MPERRVRGLPEGGLDQILRAYALREVKQLSADDVLAELREEGITSLEELVQATLSDVASARDPGSISYTFVYSDFIYKDNMPAPDDVIRALRRTEG